MMKNKIKKSNFQMKYLCLLLGYLMIPIAIFAQSGGLIILNQQMPETSVVVIATEQICLKPGFSASGTLGNFNAKIGVSNSLVPNLVLAEGSNVEIPVAPNDDQNYIKTSIALSGGENAPMMTTFQYFDGLGRPVQTVQVEITSGNNDLVTYQEYEGVGRESNSWLPRVAESNYGAFINFERFKNLPTNLYQDDESPYSTTIYEPSPLNRVMEQYGPGAAWHSNSKRATTAYDTNDGSIACFHVNESGNLARTDNYNPATLYKTTVSDEDEKPVSEYKDKLGRIVLKEGALNTQTYYVYNDLGQLSYVIPPTAADSLPNTAGPINDDDGVLKRYAYLYKYDEQGNQIFKRLPGCEPIRMVYDKANRLVLSQDGNQKLKQQWLVTKYDVLGRLLYTGITENSSSHEDLIDDLKDEVVVESWSTGSGIGNTGYTCDKYTPENLMTVNYYDNYNFIALTDAALTYDNSSEDEYGYKHPSAKGLLTGMRTYLLDGSNNYTATAQYYDFKGQVIQSRSSNHLGGYDYIYNQYNFTGNVNKTLKEHNIPEQSTVMVLYEYTYDHALRLMTTTCTQNKNQNNSGPVVLASNSYDELGRLVEKKRHNNTDIEQFEYNIRGWATKIKSGDFEQNLYYNTNINNTFAEKCYNGNIAYTTWTYNDATKAYVYDYDEHNRLTEATAYQTNGYTLYAPNNKEKFDYDKQGNIVRLWRDQDYSGVDFLQMTYYGNQVKSITDAYTSQGLYDVKEYQDKTGDTSNEMSYDTNGNMIRDLDRDIVTIKYNLLNLPDTIQFKSGHQILNTYDASGRKLKSVHVTNLNNAINPIDTGAVYHWTYNPAHIQYSGTAYVDDIEYSISKEYVYQYGGYYIDRYSLNRINNPEGYTDDLTYYRSSTRYNYYRRDYLGNIREVWKAPRYNYSGLENAQTVQCTQYYPSGLRWAYSGFDNLIDQPYKYNGKEFLEMHGLDEYDSDARWYYPAIMRTTTMDPLAEKYYDISPYAWCGNNPVRFVDPDGREVVISGVLSNEALSQLKERTKDIITLKMNEETGKLSYTVNEGMELKGDAKQMASMIDNNSITVNLTTTDKKETSTGNLMVGGAFMGNTVTKDAAGNTVVVASQEVNPNVLGTMSNAHGTPGQDMLHEATEAYQGALISQQSGVSSPPSNHVGSVYTQAHNNASPQSGAIIQSAYGMYGMPIPVMPNGTYAFPVQKVEWSVTNTTNQKVIIQRFP